MAQFVQIGNRAVNIDMVASVEFEMVMLPTSEELPVVYLYSIPVSLDDVPRIASFEGDDYEHFKSWWDNHSCVYVIK